MKRKFPWSRVVGRLIFLALFAVSATVLVASVNGYLYDSHERKFVQTGLINLTTDQLPVAVTVEKEKKVYKRSPINISYLLPGRYNVEVEKPGYFTWSKSVIVHPGQVVINPFVELFLVESQPELATDEQKNLLANQPLKPEFNDLDVRGREIWVKPIVRTYPFVVASDNFALITRYSVPVLRATWFPGHTHVAFQVGKDIHVVDRDGSNDNVLVTLEHEGVSNFAITNDGKTLVFTDGEVTYQRTLQP